jgi:ribosome-binding ATPase YchF (GTP1/OBG family)
MNTRLKKISEIKRLAKAPQSLTIDDQSFLKQHFYKQQPIMIVHNSEDRKRAEDILSRINDTETIVTVISKWDMEL